jgi:hypothetical protein
LFRNCISKELFDGGFAEFRGIDTNDSYRAWAFHLASTLQRRWREELKQEFGFPRAMKLVNLLAKGLCTVSPIWQTLSKTIAKCIDVPLDQYSLRLLACIEELKHLRKASMGSIKDKGQYGKIPTTIRVLCDKAEKPPIAMIS